MSRHGPHLAVGVGSVQSRGTRGRSGRSASPFCCRSTSLVVYRCRFREVQSLHRGGQPSRSSPCWCCSTRDRSFPGWVRPALLSSGQRASEVDRATDTWMLPTPGLGDWLYERSWAALFGPSVLAARCRCDRRSDRVAARPVRDPGRRLRNCRPAKSVCTASWKAALRPTRVAIAGDTGIGDALPRSRPTFAAWTNVSMLAVAFSFAATGAMLATLFDRDR